MKMRAACEAVLWGKTVPKTLSEMGSIEREIKSKFGGIISLTDREGSRPAFRTNGTAVAG
jgi:hypothetical protein